MPPAASISAASFLARSSRRSPTTTRAPRRAKDERGCARPIPLPPPVMTAAAPLDPVGGSCDCHSFCPQELEQALLATLTSVARHSDAPERQLAAEHRAGAVDVDAARTQLR